jgi:hypothetical protein
VTAREQAFRRAGFVVELARGLELDDICRWSGVDLDAVGRGDAGLRAERVVLRWRRDIPDVRGKDGRRRETGRRGSDRADSIGAGARCAVARRVRGRLADQAPRRRGRCEDGGSRGDSGRQPQRRAEPQAHAHPFDASSIAVQACNSGHIDVSRVRVAHTLSTMLRNATSTA